MAIPPFLASEVAADRLREQGRQSVRAEACRKTRGQRVDRRVTVRAGELLIAVGRRLAPDDRGVPADLPRRDRGCAPA